MNRMYLNSKYHNWIQFDEFIFDHFSYTDFHGRMSLTKEHIFNISQLARIMAKFEIYLRILEDIEQASYVCQWFEKEFEEMGYSLSYFRQWLAEKREIEAPF